MSDPKVAIAITADDRTAKGVASAEKRLGQIPKHASALNRRSSQEMEAGITRSSRGILKSLAQVEQATSRAFGTRSLTGGLTARLGALGQAGAAAGSGIAEASAAGGVLSTVAGGLAAGVGATVGVLMAAAYAAFKLADGWAKGANALGNTIAILGVGTKEMQAFGAAAERVGVDRDKATSGLGGLQQTLDDARYGRNTVALGTLARLGIKLKLKADGTVDTAAMLPAIADAMQRQNASGRRTLARSLGIGSELIPVMMQGGRALSADMSDAEQHAPMLSDEDIRTGRRITRKGARVSQLGARAMNAAGRVAAETAEGGYDAVLSGATRLNDYLEGRGSGGAAAQIDRGGAAVERGGRAIERAAGAIAGRSAGRFSAGQVNSLARRAMPIKAEAMRHGFNEADATAIAANIVLESGGNHRSRERGNSGAGRGLIQWTSRDRKANFRRIMGVDVDHSTRDQQWRFLKWELTNTHASRWRKAHANGNDAVNVAAGFTRHIEAPANIARDSAERAAVAAAMGGSTPVHVTVDLRGAQPGTRATVHAGPKSRPAVSHAYQPVHGG